MKLSLSRPWGRFLVLVLSAAALQIILRLCLGVMGDAGALLLVLFMYGLLPAASILIPLWAGRGGVPPAGACLPIGGAALIFSSIPPWLCGVCILLSLVAATAGQEWEKRKEKKKGSRHGGRNQKR